MNLAEKLNEKSLTAENKRDAIVKEIVDYFKMFLEGGEFEEWLEQRISSSEEAQRKRSYEFDVEAWMYHDGCSETHFHVGKYYWYNPDTKNGFKSRYYKDIYLNEIFDIAGPKILNLVDYYLKDMGFSVTVEDKQSWLKYYHKEITIHW